LNHSLLGPRDPEALRRAAKVPVVLALARLLDSGVSLSVPRSMVELADNAFGPLATKDEREVCSSAARRLPLEEFRRCAPATAAWSRAIVAAAATTTYVAARTVALASQLRADVPAH
jgi:hypothetical protein